MSLTRITTDEQHEAFLAVLPAFTAWIEASRPLTPAVAEAYRPLHIATQMVAEGRHPAEVVAYIEKQVVVAETRLSVLEELLACIP